MNVVLYGPKARATLLKRDVSVLTAGISVQPG